MTRFLSPFAAAARGVRSAHPMQISGAATGRPRDLVPVHAHSAAPAARARLTNFRRAIQG